MAGYRIACKRNKAVQNVHMAASIESDPAIEMLSLLNLQQHLLERVLVRLHVTDLARCCQVSRTFQSAVNQEGVWQFLCATTFRDFSTTELRDWINPPQQSNGRYSSQFPHQATNTSLQTSRGPQTYRSALMLQLCCFAWLLHHRQLHSVSYSCRQLFPVLKQLEPLIGIWRHERKADKAALYVFDWAHRCVEGRKLCYDVVGQDPFVEPFQQVGPASNAQVQHVDSMHCLLTVQIGTPRSPITKAVQAATAVAVGGIPIPKRVSVPFSKHKFPVSVSVHDVSQIHSLS